MMLGAVILLLQSHAGGSIAHSGGVSMTYPRGWRATTTKPVQRPADGSMESDDADKPVKDILLIRVEKGKSAYAELRKSSWADLMYKRSQQEDQESGGKPTPIGSYHFAFANGSQPVLVGKQIAYAQMWENDEGFGIVQDVVQFDVKEPNGKIYRLLCHAKHTGPIKGRVVDNTDGVLMPRAPLPEMSAALPAFESMLASIKTAK